MKTCHISSQNGYILETKPGGGLKIGQNIKNDSNFMDSTNLHCNTVEHRQNQLICHFAMKTCHISSQNGYISETKLVEGLKIGQNIKNVLQFLGLN